MSGPLGKQILGVRLISKKRAYIGLGVLLLIWFGFRSFVELSTAPIGLMDAYALMGLGFAIMVFATGLRISSDG